MNEANAGSLSKVEMQRKKKKLSLPEEIQKYEAQMQEKRNGRKAR